MKKTKKEGIILLTGDIHNGQILKTPCVIEGIGYDLYEITSSGLGHYCKPKCDIIIDYILPRMYKVSNINVYNVYIMFSLQKQLIIIITHNYTSIGERTKKHQV